MKKGEVLFAEKAAVREYVVNDKTVIEDQDPNRDLRKRAFKVHSLEEAW